MQIVVIKPFHARVFNRVSQPVEWTDNFSARAVFLKWIDTKQAYQPLVEQ